MLYYRHPHVSRLLTISFLLLFTGGCSTIGDVPPAMRVDLGEHPAHQDEQVRFRTTYYFRIADSCKVQEGKNQSGDDKDYTKDQGPFKVRQSGKLKIVSDSLYRFRMTGKASALFAKIRFESGVLRSEQIDPFGSQVALDKNTNTFRVIPANAMRENVRREEIDREIDRLINLKKRLNESGQKTHDDLIATMIENQIKLLGNENDSGVGSSKNATTGRSNATTTELLCPDGRPTQRSYFLYGPEGVRRLDPDERLLMAMTSDSKPLIGMLQQLAGKSLHSQQIHENEWKDIADERASVSHARRDIESFEKKPTQTFEELIKKLETRFGSKP
jgi:hypothetical protein